MCFEKAFLAIVLCSCFSVVNLYAKQSNVYDNYKNEESTIKAETDQKPAHELEDEIGTKQSTKKIHFEFTTGLGISSSINNEYVFENSKMISKLEWLQYASPILNADAKLSFFNTFVQVEMIFAIPMKCGVLNDYDFLLTNSDAISKYSHHAIYLDKHFDLSFKTGYEFSFGNKDKVHFKLIPYTILLYRMQKWAAHNGYFQYPSSGKWTGNEEKQQVSGNIVTYEQSIFLPQLSLRFDVLLQKKWAFSVWFAACPYIISDTLDSHFLRNQQFFDTLRGGFDFTIGTQILYKKFLFSFTYEYLSVKNGTTHSGTIGNIGAFAKSNSTPGITSHKFTILASYKF